MPTAVSSTRFLASNHISPMQSTLNFARKITVSTNKKPASRTYSDGSRRPNETQLAPTKLIAEQTMAALDRGWYYTCSNTVSGTADDKEHDMREDISRLRAGTQFLPPAALADWAEPSKSRKRKTYVIHEPLQLFDRYGIYRTRISVLEVSTLEGMRLFPRNARIGVLNFASAKRPVRLKSLRSIIDLLGYK